MDDNKKPNRAAIPLWELKLLSVLGLCIFASSVYFLIERGRYGWDQWSMVILTFMLVPGQITLKCVPGGRAHRASLRFQWAWMAFAFVYYICVRVWGSR
jgi:hypothetical protein